MPNNNSTYQRHNKKQHTTTNSHAAQHGYTAAFSTQATESTQWRNYKHKGGHGYAAEDSNALNDRMHGRRVEKTGQKNESNGPDRIVNGVKIQTKYCDSASHTIRTSFDKKTGMFRYPGQKLEVPKDQYEEAVKLMEAKIKEGKVDGVTDPAQARNIVKQGKYTYKQAQNQTKAGNLDSITFDIKNQAGASAKSAAISAANTYISAKANGASTKTALKASGKQAVSTGARSMTTGVVTQQVLRTGAGRTASAALEKGIGKGVEVAMKTEAGKKVIEKTASAIGKKAVQGTAAKQVLVRAGSTNAVTAAISAGVSIAPDIYRLASGEITEKEFAQRTACTVSGAAGGTGGTMAGAAIGSMICPGIGTAIGGFIGGMIGEMGASSLAGKLFKK